MTVLEQVVDNDILIKFSLYDLLQYLTSNDSEPRSVGVLGAAKWVVGDALTKKTAAENAAAAAARFQAFLGHAHSLEPTAEEVALATLMEEEASLANLPLDAGESQLCAIAIVRSVPLVVTGDKRAIGALEALQQVVTDLSALRGRIACAEQVIAAIMRTIGGAATRLRVCAEPLADKALTICFECRSGPMPDYWPQGLASYITHLRTQAPHLLHEEKGEAPS